MREDTVLEAWKAFASDLRECLHLVQWRGYKGTCPWCRESRGGGHSDECELDAILSIDMENTHEAKKAGR